MPEKSGTIKSTRVRKISQIWCLARDLHLDGENKDLLKLQILQATGKDSISALSEPQLDKAIHHLKVLLAKQRSTSVRNLPRLQLPTPSQRKKVELLLQQINSHVPLHDPEAYLNGVANKSYQKAYKALNRQQLQGVIEALKVILNRISNHSHPLEAS